MPKILIQNNISLAPLSNFKIGGPAEFFVEIKKKDELKEARSWARKNNKIFFILGGGSNLLINGKGVSGLVIKLANDEIILKGNRMECGAGALLSKIAGLAGSQNLTGMEWSIGIPRATLGGAIRGNAEAFNVAMSDAVETVEAFNTLKSKFQILSKGDCQFSYRSSLFKEKKEYIIWSAVLKLKKGDKEEIKNINDSK